MAARKTINKQEVKNNFKKVLDMTEQTSTKTPQSSNDKFPAFHITGGKGWINDPNGLVYYNGEYHVFFQYHPYGTTWGPMHWGHVVSTDLTNWKRLPIALTPGGEGDKDGCFSGSAICAFGKLFIMYTGFEENGGGEKVRQVQCLAESDDGVNFKKHGVVIGSDDLPEGFMPCDFRDPYVFCHEGKFYCLVAAKKKEGRGRVLLYRSADLFKWEFLSDTLGFDSDGIMFECPDFIEELGLLTVCDQLQPSGKNDCLNVHSARYFLGKMDFETGKFTIKKQGILDYGFDYYAPQSFAESSKNTIMGWLNMWDRNVPSSKYGFAGMLTAAREIRIENGDIFQTPVLKTKQVLHTLVDCKISDRAIIGVIVIEADALESCEIKLREDESHLTSIKLVDGYWVFDRFKSGEIITGAEKDELSLSGIRKMKKSSYEKTTITLILDKYSVEFFEGGKVMSSTIYPPENADKVEVCVKAKKCAYTRYDIAE